MCGIAGIWSKDGGRIPEYRILRMMEVMKHRGPDAEGSWNIPGLAFGHTRLKIVDLSDAANQPFTDGQNALVFNGEIFNFRELRKELLCFFDFATKSDTEVLFRALQVWGVHTLKKIDGQFAFAYYRAEENSVLLARDHVGICPLYVWETDNELLFSSEIRPMLELKRSRLNHEAVIDYFTYRYNIQNGLTLFDGVERFAPAHYWLIDLNTKHITKKRYWQLQFTECNYRQEEIRDKLNTLLDEQISAQSLADVPVGIYLSGGVDSRSLLHGFSKTVSPIHSFTVRFAQDDEDLKRIETLEREISFNKNVIQFTPSVADNIDDVVFSLEEPFGDLIICANYILPQKASQIVKVALSGEGGDEAFVGYDHQRAFLKMTSLEEGRVTRLLMRLLLRSCPTFLLSMANTYPGRFGADEHSRILRVFNKISSPADAYIQLISLYDEAKLQNLFSNSFFANSSQHPDRKPIREIFAQEKHPWQAVMRSEIEQLTLIVNLLKQDRFGMRFSLEGRVPLVGRQVLEFAATLPFDKLITKINKECLLYYSRSKPIRKKPFSVLASPLYRKILLDLMGRYVNRETVYDCGVLSWSEITHVKKGVRKGTIIAVKKAMAITIFMIWWQVFRSYLRH